MKKNYFHLGCKLSIALFLSLTIQVYSQTTQIHQVDFESGVDSWALAGTNTFRSTGGAYKNSFKLSMAVNGSTATSPNINTSGFDKVDIEMFIRSNDASTNHTVTIQYRPNNTSAWQDIRVVTKGDGTNNRDINFNGGYHYITATLLATSTTFGNNAQFRLITSVNSNFREFFIDYITIFGTNYKTVSTAPGGIASNLDLWLRADMVDGVSVQTDNSDVNTWIDFGLGNNAKVTDATNPNVARPQYRNNAVQNVNFNPVVSFANNTATAPKETTYLNSNRQFLYGTSGFHTNDFFAVVIPDTPISSGTNPPMDVFTSQRVSSNPYDEDITGFGFGNYSARFSGEVIAYALGTNPSPSPSNPNLRGYGIAEVSGNTYSTIGIVNARNNTSGTQELFLNGLNIGNTEVGVPQFSNENNRRFWLGRSQVFDGSYNGRIAEVVTYSSRKDDVAERIRIESYLAVKYGITLGVNGISQNYQDSSGNIIWDASFPGFNFDIAGIGRDDASLLNQKQSKSQNNGVNPPILTMGLGDILPTNTANTNTFDTDRAFLVWGSNGLDMNNSGTPISLSFGPDVVTTSTEVPNRKWRLVETGGNVPTVKVSVPTTAVSTIIPPVGNDAFVMVVADDPNFTTNIETVFMTQNGANQEVLFDFDGVKYITFGVAHETVTPRHLTFDGFDDFVRTDNAPVLNTNFTMMGWIRTLGPNATSSDQTIVSNTDGGNGFLWVIRNNGRFQSSWAGGGSNTIESSVNIPVNEWHHLAVTFDGTLARLYIDGVLDKSEPKNVPAVFSNVFSIGAEFRTQADIRNFFNGNLEEIRIWDRTLSPEEIRFIMNQEIEQAGSGTLGKIIPGSVTKNDLASLDWNRLTAYYSMNSFIGTHINDDSQNNQRGRLIVPNKVQVFNQTAPLPYISANNGAWSNTATWRDGNIMPIPNSTSIVDGLTTVDWNIVRSAHNIFSNGNKTLLGLFVDANVLAAQNDSKIEVSHYLKLDGVIDLEGRSQLIQNQDSDLDPTSAGILQRDQQGTTDIFKYNYWSSPVGLPNNSTNNNDYSLDGVLRDGTNPANPLSINWISGLDGAPTTPISISTFWTFKFDNSPGFINNWIKITPTDLLKPGIGYIHKGSGASGSFQNYVFQGKPNNGQIQHTISGTMLTLFGNPYPSAFDYRTFISDNLTAVDGTVYMWEHWGGGTHNLLDYQGGYSVCNLIGCVPALSHPSVNQTGSGTITPGRFLPVGQAFFLFGDADGGTITFDNSYRAFIKEDNPQSSIHFEANKPDLLSVFEDPHFNDNQEDSFSSSQAPPSIRYEYTTPDGFKRQLLLGFLDGLATDDYDKGFDARNLDQQLNDMYFVQNENKLSIQGVGALNLQKTYPLGITANTTGTASLKILQTNNIPTDVPIYFFDKQTQERVNLREQPLNIEISTVGEIRDRFEIQFTDSTLSAEDFEEVSESIKLFFEPESLKLKIANNTSDFEITDVQIFDLLGRRIHESNSFSPSQNNIELFLPNVSSGIYLVKMQSVTGQKLTKKTTFQLLD
ncbi:MAG: T9SS type A sorting domain-containing protein [Bacteroidetes bacterium]|nr:T9SS type A sorting domain-containing protein [Bacteroidota bacterium]